MSIRGIEVMGPTAEKTASPESGATAKSVLDTKISTDQVEAITGMDGAAVEADVLADTPTPTSEHVLDLQAAQETKDANVAKAQAAFASSQASAGIGMSTDGHPPMPDSVPAPGSESDPLTVDHSAPTENDAGEPVVEMQPEKKKGFFRSLLDKAQRKG